MACEKYRTAYKPHTIVRGCSNKSSAVTPLTSNHDRELQNLVLLLLELHCNQQIVLLENNVFTHVSILTDTQTPSLGDAFY